jgi:hemimethylated DNA binding protein
LMNDMLAYEYPVDFEMQQERIQKASENQNDSTEFHHPDFGTDDLPPLSDEQVNTIAVDVLSKTKKFIEKLIQIMRDDMPEEHHNEKLSLLQAFCGKLEAKVPLPRPHHEHSVRFVTKDTNPVASASAHLRHLLNFALELRDVLWHREKLQEADNIQFQLGQVVDHKFFNFRGVVLAIDPKPTIDVSRWDGVQHIDNPGEQPFYHILPDQDDCLNAFGGPRGMRYVCQENLEACQGDRRKVNVPIEAVDPGWTRDDATMEFVPPSHVKVSLS